MTTATPTLRAQVLALRRTHSARAVAQALSIPLGTVKAISSRAGRRFGRRCIRIVETLFPLFLTVGRAGRRSLQRTPPLLLA